jgi:hypothetical protein
MPINKKALLLAALILGAASQALANAPDVYPDSIQSAQKWSGHRPRTAEMLAANRDAFGSARINSDSTIWRERASVRWPSAHASTCPWLEGYPDCHPGDFQAKE